MLKANSELVCQIEEMIRHHYLLKYYFLLNEYFSAQCYRIARDMPNSKECHIKAADAFRRNNVLFHAAKSLENAIIVSKEFATPQEVSLFYFLSRLEYELTF